MNFKYDVKKPCKPSGFLYGYKSDRTMYPYFPHLELTEEKRNEDHIIIPFYEDDFLDVKEFNNFIEEDIYLNNDFIDYKDGTFDLGYTKLGKEDVYLTDEKTNCSLLLGDPNQGLVFLNEINYFEFLDLVKKVKEFDDEDPASELRYVTGLGGKFLKLENKGFCCLERISKKYIYISYLGVFEEYRKQGNLERIIKGVKVKYPDQQIILGVVNDKIKAKYLELGFKQIGYLKNFE